MTDSAASPDRPLHIPHGINELPSAWSWGKLEDLCSGVFDCPHSTPKRTDEGPLMARTQDVMTGIFRA